MSDLKSMYSTVVAETYPDTLTLSLGDQTLVYRKRVWDIGGERKGLRYGENPDQPAALYRLESGQLSLGGVTWRGPGQALVSAMDEGHMLQAGKHPGKTNLTDVDNAANMLQYLCERPAALIIKHNNPCGAAWSKEGVADALSKAFWCDRIAAFGGAVVVNRPFTREAAELVAQNYFEVVAAPGFEEGTVELLKSRKNLRIMELPGLGRLEGLASTAYLDVKCLADGGLVVQKSFQNRILSNQDFLPASGRDKAGTVYTARRPSPAELDDLRFAWAVEAGVTSNSVIFARDGATTSIGTGEQDRVGCVELAVYKAYRKHEDALAFRSLGMGLYELKARAADEPDLARRLAEIQEETRQARGGLKGSVLISDGFFPFRDGVDVAMAEGVTAIGQPGGSLRDWEVVKAVNEHSPQVAMVFTGQRSFKH